MEKKYIVSHLVLIIIILVLGFLFYSISSSYEDYLLNDYTEKFFSKQVISLVNSVNFVVDSNEEVEFSFSKTFKECTDISCIQASGISFNFFDSEDFKKKLVYKIKNIEQKFSIRDWVNNKKVCNYLCGVGIENCYIVSFIIQTPGYVENICLNIPEDTSFFGYESECGTKTGFTLIDPKISIPEGNYLIKNVSDLNEFPKLCFYKEN